MYKEMYNAVYKDIEDKLSLIIKMSGSKVRPSAYYSPHRVECDQKDVIISHLKEEVYHLQHHQQDFYRLQDQYRSLDHKFRLLSEEKSLSDAQFRERHETALRSISQLQGEIDSLRSQLREKNLQIDDLESDESTLLAQLDQRIVEIEKLKLEMASISADNAELLDQRNKIEQAISNVRKDNDALAANMTNILSNSDAVKRRTDDLDRHLLQLKNQENMLKAKITGYEDENNDLDAEINTTNEEISRLEADVSERQRNLNQVQSMTAEAGALAEKHKSEAVHHQRSAQNESSRNNDLSKNIAQAEQTLKVRKGQVEEGTKQIAGLSQENGELSALNGGLKDDIEYCRRHLENMGLQNMELVMHLEKYGEEDQVVRNLIDRKVRVTRARVRVDQANVLINRTNTLQGSIRKTKVIY